MKRLLQMPKVQMILALNLIFITAFFHKPNLQIAGMYVTSILLAIGFDLLLVKIRRIEFFFPSAALVTGSIIGLLNSPNLPLYEIGVVALLAIVSKHFVKKERRHIFNPAAFGFFFAGLLFRHNVSWWGVSFVPFIVLFLPGYISGIKIRRFKIIISFIIVYSLLNYFLNHFFPLFDPTVLFFTLVMLPEPMTTPNKPVAQMIFGIFVAIVSILVSVPVSYFGFRISDYIPDPLITALLLGNLIFLRWR